MMNYYSTTNNHPDLRPQQLRLSPYQQQQPNSNISYQHGQVPLPQLNQHTHISHSSHPSPRVHAHPIPVQNQDFNLFTQLHHASTTTSQTSPQLNQQQLSHSHPAQPVERLSLSQNTHRRVSHPTRQDVTHVQESYTHDGRHTSTSAIIPLVPISQQATLAEPDPHADQQSPILSPPVDTTSESPLQPKLTQAEMVPPPEGTYATFDELIYHANQHAFAHGYALVIARSKKKGPHNYKKVLIACDRWGPVQHSGLRPEHLQKRKTTSKKTDCKFGVLAQESATEWKLCHRPDHLFSTHNHGPSQDMSKHAAARKLNASALAAVKVFAELGLSVKETVERIQADQPGSMIIARDVYNARAMLKREPTKFPDVDPELLPPMVMRAKMTPEERIRDECRAEVAKANKELEDSKAALEKLRHETTAEIQALKLKMMEKDRQIAKFEMFIDICNERVMVQRERIFNDGGSSASAQNDKINGT